MAGLQDKLDELKQSLLEYDVALDVRMKETMHDRAIQLANGWTNKIGRGLDVYQKPEGWYAIGAVQTSSLRRLPRNGRLACSASLRLALISALSVKCRGCAVQNGSC